MGGGLNGVILRPCSASVVGVLGGPRTKSVAKALFFRHAFCLWGVCSGGWCLLGGVVCWCGAVAVVGGVLGAGSGFRVEWHIGGSSFWRGGWALKF